MEGIPFHFSAPDLVTVSHEKVSRDRPLPPGAVEERRGRRRIFPFMECGKIPSGGFRSRRPGHAPFSKRCAFRARMYERAVKELNSSKKG